MKAHLMTMAFILSTGLCRAQVKLTTAQSDRLTAEAVQVCADPRMQDLEKADGKTLAGAVLGFRKDGAEVAVLADGKMAWVKLDYFTPWQQQSLTRAQKEMVALQKRPAQEAWQKAREQAELDIRRLAAQEWPGDYKMQAYEIKTQMAAWDRLHPEGSAVQDPFAAAADPFGPTAAQGLEGKPAAPPPTGERCTKCNGFGKVTATERTKDGKMPCPDCQGTGKKAAAR